MQSGCNYFKLTKAGGRDRLNNSRYFIKANVIVLLFLYVYCLALDY